MDSSPIDQLGEAVQIVAAHSLSSPQAQPPKQSSVPLLHSSVHMVAEQSGLVEGAPQVVG